MPIEWDLKKRVAIRNLGNTPTKNEIKSLFERYGTINKLWVARYPPGLAFLEFERRSSAKTAARELDGKSCCGSRIKVDLSLQDYASHSERTSLRRYDSRRTSRLKDKERIKNYGRAHDSNPHVSRTSPKIAHSRFSSSTSTRINRNNARSENTSDNRRSRRTRSRQRLDCSICFGNILKREPTITPCRHVFCSSCIRLAIQQKEKCPLCQETTQEKQLLPIYLNP